ncbi:MAG: ABC transporter ATP-binding protein [Gaiellales bacterium]
MAASAPMLVVDGISRAFDGLPALAPTSMTVAAGEFVSLVGPSGCGKSTLFNVISGLVAPDAGRVEIAGRDVTGRPGSVGYMLQKDLLAPWRTVLGNIVLGAALTRGVTADDRAAAAELAARHGLGDYLDHYPHALSGGMRQRVALMRTLASGRNLLLLDEPFGALDAQTRLGMHTWLQEVRAATGSTVLFVTHDVDEAVFLSDRVLVMGPRPGAIVEELAIDLPRPRTLEMSTSEAAVAAKRRILSLLHGEAAA